MSQHESSSPHRNFIGGQWVESVSGETYRTINPARPKEVVGTFQASIPQDAENAINAAAKAAPGWGKMPAPQRGTLLYKALDIFERRTDELARAITVEEGKPIADATGEVKRAMNILEYSAGEGRRLFGYTTPSELPDTTAYTFKRPLGVVSIITPWNFPLLLGVAKIAPALVAGNTFVLKPAPTTPVTSLMVGEMAADILPAGVLNIVTDANDLGPALTDHPDVAKVSFTGSTATGKKVMAAAASSLKRITLELGGNDAAILLDDIDVEAAAPKVFGGAFTNAGQVCIAVKRLYVHESQYDAMCEELAKIADETVQGDGLEQGILVGIHHTHAQCALIIQRQR